MVGFGMICADTSVFPKVVHTMKVTRKTRDHDALCHLAEPQAGYFTARQASRAGFSWEQFSVNPEGSNRVFVSLSTKAFSGTPY